MHPKTTFFLQILKKFHHIEQQEGNKGKIP